MTHAARARATAWARRITSDPRAVFLDTETSGLGPDAEIVDLAIVRIDGAVLLDTLVRPTNPIPAAATAVHGITDAMVADAEPWPAVYGRLCEALSDTIVIYNRDYDLAVINACCAAHDLPTFASGDRWQCALLAYADWAGEPGRYPGSYRWHKLGEAAARFGFEPGTHRALADAEACRRVVVAMSQEAVDELRNVHQGTNAAGVASNREEVGDRPRQVG